MLKPILAENRRQLAFIDTILRQINAADYQREFTFAGAPSIGKHIRHVLGHYAQLQQAISTGEVDYRQRERDRLVQANPLAALGLLQQQLDWLDSLAQQIIDPNLRYQCAEGEGTTSLLRELDFVASHAVHHLALLKILLQQLGYNLPDTAGVHSSTLAYLKPCAP
ncbi:hypothetical protein GCM10010919_04410 [Alishewanella longhuensis]|uniref:DinB family protein n=1 Tax=Alishewanella longhuensis TaxID=1091037 RepID=A0ABQ3KUZ3_9ALTE|nr:DinB family protein [Alishewanella longhuensis]GHG60737.1 hypothetical protein GCM10010919_04410 [Alishewanella longhuensis]